MHRFFIDPDRSADGDLFLAEEDARHAVTVLRLKAGQHVEIIGSGQRCEAEIVSACSRDVLVRPVSPLPSTEPRLSVTLFQGLPKGDKMDLIVQKATELGVCRIVPVIMDRCVARLSPQDVPRRLERWSRISREAAKQSGRCLVPVISAPVAIQDLPALDNLPGAKVVPWENAAGYGCGGRAGDGRQDHRPAAEGQRRHGGGIAAYHRKDRGEAGGHLPADREQAGGSQRDRKGEWRMTKRVIAAVALIAIALTVSCVTLRAVKKTGGALIGFLEEAQTKYKEGVGQSSDRKCHIPEIVDRQVVRRPWLCL